jgi:hypothetical protein
MADSCRTVFTPETTPSGLEVAKKFPWWATSYQDVTDNNNILDKFVFRAPQGNRQAFANDKPWPVYIDEIRFWAALKPSTTGQWAYPAMMEQTCFKISTDLQREIVSRWMPGSTFNTEQDRHLYGYTQNAMFTLPAPYYLPYGSQFFIELETQHAALTGDTVQCALRGCDPYNETPSVLLTRPNTLPDGTATPRPGRLALAFDDNRDRPVRNMWVRDFSITRLNAPTGSWSWRLLDVKFNPPEGPSWTSDITTPLVALCDQVGDVTQTGTTYDPPVIHRPPRPYILRPGDAMTIECQVRYDPNVTYIADHRIWAHVRGWQMGEGI